MTFTEATTVERMALDTVIRPRSAWPAPVGEPPLGYPGSLGPALRPAQWKYVPAPEIPRTPGDVVVEAQLCRAAPVHRSRPRGDGAG